MTDIERAIMDRACAVASAAMEGGPLIPRLSIPGRSRLRCAAEDESYLRDRFVPGTSIVVDPTLAAGQCLMEVALPTVAEHIDCTIGFVNPPEGT